MGAIHGGARCAAACPCAHEALTERADDSRVALCRRRPGSRSSHASMRSTIRQWLGCRTRMSSVRRIMAARTSSTEPAVCSRANVRARSNMASAYWATSGCGEIGRYWAAGNGTGLPLGNSSRAIDSGGFWGEGWAVIATCSTRAVVASGRADGPGRSGCTALPPEALGFANAPRPCPAPRVCR